MKIYVVTCNGNVHSAYYILADAEFFKQALIDFGNESTITICEIK